jgi:hypothetical protein
MTAISSSASGERLDLNELSSGEKAAAAAFVLAQGYPVPPPPGVGQVLSWARDDIERAVDRVRSSEPHRFANLFGSVGQAGGALTGAVIGKLLPDRGAWTALLVGTLLGAYPPAIAGAAIDKLVD